MKIDLLEPAREFCREHECSNVGLIHQAMMKGAEIATNKIEEQRHGNLNPETNEEVQNHPEVHHD
ncbi:MAG TPA: hypothetical protein VFU31_30530 [Candidatus Binatia bacterium]|nr:hypothetical protein [Candidatus Binatia bacterium]